MDIAIVTGAETPLGLSLIQRLVRQGYRVHGIGNNFSKVTWSDPQFKAHPVDLSDLASVSAVMQGILQQDKSVDLLIHAIDVTPGGAFEKLPLGNLEAVLKIGLLGPVMLTRLALPNLLRFRGQLINIIPANKSGSPASAVNALLEGGLRAMNSALFDRARDAGLRVTNLVLRQNPEPDALSVQSSGQTRIDLEDVARAVEHLIDPNFANVPAELVLYPRCSAHSDHALPRLPEPLDPYSEVVLPPQAYCPPKQPKIPTLKKQRVERSIPYTDDEIEDKIAAAIEDFEAHPERYDVREPSRHERKLDSANRSDSPETAGSGKRRRGRRRSGRNRNRDRESNVVSPSESSSSVRIESQKQPEPKQAQTDASSSKSPRRSDPQRHRSENTTRLEPKPQAEPKAKAQAKTEAKPEAPKKMPLKKAAKKVAKKAAKKMAKKTAVKKAPAKKAAKKAAKKVAKKAVKTLKASSPEKAD